MWKLKSVCNANELLNMFQLRVIYRLFKYELTSDAQKAQKRKKNRYCDIKLTAYELNS